MRKKNILAVITAVLMIFMWSGAVFAANTAAVNVTSEPIHYQAESDKGGGITITFDSDTVLTDGDQITADLTFGVYLARDIDIDVSMGASATGWTTIPASDAPFTDPTGAATPTGGIYFHVYGTDGSQRITIDIIGDAPGDSVTVGPDVDDRLELSFLDQATNDDYGTDGIWNNDTGVAATLGENTLCIDVSTYTGTVVRASFDSAGDKFHFVPSDPEIAHVVEAIDISFETCEKSWSGKMDIGYEYASQGGSGSYCYGFDNEDESGYCSSPNDNTMVIGGSNPFDLAEYMVTMEILVNGAAGDNGVYFANDDLEVGGFDTAADACAMTSMMSLTTNYQLYNGSSATPEGQSSSCTVANDARAVRLITDADDLGLVSTNDFMSFDMPSFNYILSMIAVNDTVEVRVTVTKVPCGIIFTGDFYIGAFGCPTEPTIPTACISFPYFTDIGADSDAYWDGIVITNMASTAGTATVTAYEADGDQGQAVVSVGAMSQYVNLLSLMPWTQIAGTGTWGDSSCYVKVNVSGSSMIDGFGMMARQDTGESMGYLPRCCGDWCCD